MPLRLGPGLDVDQYALALNLGEKVIFTSVAVAVDVALDYGFGIDGVGAEVLDESREGVDVLE